MSVLESKRTEEVFEGAHATAIKKYQHGKEGGAVLDVTDFTDKHICIGHGVILENDTYKPQPTDGSKHTLLVGVVRSTTKTSHPSVGVMTQGVINNNALKYPFTADALEVLKAQGIYNQVD